MPATILTITIACPREIDGKEGRREMAAFWGELLGLNIVREDWLRIAKGIDSRPHLALDGDGWSDQRPPRWGATDVFSDPTGHPFCMALPHE